MEPVVIIRETDPFCGTRLNVKFGNKVYGRFKYNSSLDCYEGAMFHGLQMTFKSDKDLINKIRHRKQFDRIQFEDHGTYLISLDYGLTWTDVYEADEKQVKQYWPHILQSMKPNVMDNLAETISKDKENWKVFLLAYLHRIGSLKVKPLQYYENR